MIVNHKSELPRVNPARDNPCKKCGALTYRYRDICSDCEPKRTCPVCKESLPLGRFQIKYEGGLCDLCGRRRSREKNDKERDRIKRMERQFGKAPGYVYVVQSPTGHYKIGHTKDLKKRARQFEVKLPFEIEFIHVIKCENRFQAERFLHKFFAVRHVEGEWYALNAQDLEYIKAIKEL